MEKDEGIPERGKSRNIKTGQSTKCWRVAETQLAYDWSGTEWARHERRTW